MNVRTEAVGQSAGLAELDGLFGGVVRAVSDFYSLANADTVAATEVLASALPDTGHVTEFLRDAVALHRSGAALDHGSSHIHRNGFTKVSLIRDQDSGWNLRLHVWWEPARDAQVHDHRWDLASLVLAGSLRAVNYRADQGDDYTIARYSDAGAGGRKSVEPSGSCTLRPIASYRLSAGDRHSLLYSEPHVLDHAEARPAATLVLTGPARRDFSRAFVPLPDIVTDTDTVQPPRILDRESAIGAIARFVGYLEESAA